MIPEKTHNHERDERIENAPLMAPVVGIAKSDAQLMFSSAGRLVTRHISDLREHPAYQKLQLSVASAQVAKLARLGDFVFKDPLLVTSQGVIIDGYARKAYAQELGITTLNCMEIDISEEDALRMILSKHHRSPGWNDYNRIQLARCLWDSARMRARANQQAGGRLKGSSKLTEANVRRERALAAGVSEGNVTKVDQLQNSEPQVLIALQTSEISIHRAWLWRDLSYADQTEQLRVYRLKRHLREPVRRRALNRQAGSAPGLSWVVLTKLELEKLLQKLSCTPSSDSALSEIIPVCLIKWPGKTAVITNELYENLIEGGYVK